MLTLRFLFNAPAGVKAAGPFEFADSSGVKGEKRSREKMAADYGGHANKLKDLARLTLRFSSARKLRNALSQLKKAGIVILTLKNKFEHQGKTN